MSAVEMRVRCPDAREIGTASLAGYRWRITVSGYASIIPSAGDVVYGVLWSISDRDERALDHYEGVDESLYRKESLRVGGVAALVYVQDDSAAGFAHPGYVEAIVSTAEARGFPERYISQLRALGYNPTVESEE